MASDQSSKSVGKDETAPASDVWAEPTAAPVDPAPVAPVVDPAPVSPTVAVKLNPDFAEEGPVYINVPGLVDEQGTPVTRVELTAGPVDVPASAAESVLLSPAAVEGSA
jgi:hypothetical protein